MSSIRPTSALPLSYYLCYFNINMCRILAISGKINHQESALILEKFQRLAEFGKIPGASKGHKDGWGIVAYEKGKPFLHARNYKDAFKDPKYSAAVEGLKDKKIDIVISHLRKASVGSRNTKNSHPFAQDNFSFCQNGTVFDSKKISLTAKSKKIVKGNSDSEKLFAYVLQCLNEKKKTDAKTISKAINESVEYIRKNFDYTAMNIVFSDGKQIWALREVNEKNFFVKKYKLLDYYSLLIGKGDGYSVICSEKLPIKNVQWKAIKNHELLRISAKNTMQKRVRGILVDDGIITLLKRVKKSETYYVFPGGGVEEGESVKQALKRELKEELGIDANIRKLLTKKRFDRGKTKQIEYFYICETSSGKLGTGKGPEYQPGNSYDGTHEVVQFFINKMKDLNLLPEEVKELVLREFLEK